MNINFSSLALMAVASCGVPWAVANPPGGEAQPATVAASSEGPQLLADAIRRMAAHASIEAKLRVSTRLMGQLLTGSGDYAQLRSSKGLLLRLDLAMQAGGKATSVRQICDGRDLWIHWKSGEQQELRRVDLVRVERAMSDSQFSATETPSGLLASGGIPRLLEQLEEFFDFSIAAPTPGRLATVPVWTTVGSWRAERIVALAPQAVTDAGLRLAALPSHLPHRVVIQFGQSDLFPYRVDYQRWEGEGDTFRWNSAVKIEFYEVAFEDELDPRQFDYRPPADMETDQTDLYLERLGVATRPPRPQR